MRRVWLTLSGCCAIACAGPPGVERWAGEGGEVEPLTEPKPAVEPEPEPELGDPLLAEVRKRVRGGRVPAGLRQRLLESESPDHRHAGRLLQAIAGEPPAAVLPRTQGGRAVVELAALGLFEPSDEPEPAADPTPEPEPEEPERSPQLSSLMVGSPVWEWFATGLVAPSPEPEPVELEARIELETIVGTLPLLLSERPPIPEARSGAGPRLVILTSLALRAEPSTATLELAGAGAVEVGVQPLGNGRVRLFVLHAGAVPGFLAARPIASGIEVVDVVRGDRHVEVELELGHGWALRGLGTLENGASVQFARRI